MNNEIWEDLKFFLERLKALPVSESLRLGNNGGFCVSTGCDLESWVYFPERVNDANIVNEAVKFFHERNISFMWPIYEAGGEKVLESAGLVYAGNLEAMTLDSEKINLERANEDVRILRVNNCADFDAGIGDVRNYSEANSTKIWARTAWHAFGGGVDDVEENYYAFVSALNNDRENLELYLAELDNEPVGTFLLTCEKNFAGVYYFGVIPELRRKKIAASMMNEICRLSRGKKIVLQATPSGVPFYEKFGFERLFTIRVYSNESDIF